MLDTRVAELTIVEFKALVREVVEETIADLLADSDDGLELRDDFRAVLYRSLKAIKEGGAGYEARDVASRLGLED